MIKETDYYTKPEKFKHSKRRHHKERMKIRTRRVFKDVWSEERMCRKEIVGRWSDNLKKCSCTICGNQRHSGIKTLQERRSELEESEYWSEDLNEWWFLCGWEEDILPDWCDLCGRLFYGMCPSCGFKSDWGC